MRTAIFVGLSLDVSQVTSSGDTSGILTTTPHLADGSGFINCDAFGRTISPVNSPRDRNNGSAVRESGVYTQVCIAHDRIAP